MLAPAQPPNCRTTLCRLSVTAYSTYSQLLVISCACALRTRVAVVATRMLLLWGDFKDFSLDQCQLTQLSLLYVLSKFVLSDAAIRRTVYSTHTHSRVVFRSRDGMFTFWLRNILFVCRYLENVPSQITGALFVQSDFYGRGLQSRPVDWAKNSLHPSQQGILTETLCMAQMHSNE